MALSLGTPLSILIAFEHSSCTSPTDSWAYVCRQQDQTFYFQRVRCASVMYLSQCSIKRHSPPSNCSKHSRINAPTTIAVLQVLKSNQHQAPHNDSPLFRLQKGKCVKVMHICCCQQLCKSKSNPTDQYQHQLEHTHLISQMSKRYT